MCVCKHRVSGNHHFIIFILVMLVVQNVYPEKIFRKMVRDKYKMVQKPFSSDGHGQLLWKSPGKNRTGLVTRHAPAFAALDKTVYRSQRPRTFLTQDRRHARPRQAVPPPPPPPRPPNVAEPADDERYNNDVTSRVDQDTLFPAVRGGQAHPPMNPFMEEYKGAAVAAAALAEAREPRPAGDDEAADFLLQGGAPPPRAGNTSCACADVPEATTIIDLEDVFSKIDLQPDWCASNTYWSPGFESRYEALMRNSKWPPLKVIMVPRTRVPSIWMKTFEQYHAGSAHRTLSNVVKKLYFYSNLTFTWHEVAHLSHWWRTTSQKNRSAFRRLLKGGRLEISTGGWVEPDEATTHLYGLLHQLVEGHQWLKQNLNYSPRVAWLTDGVSHAPGLAYLLAGAGVPHVVLAHAHFALEHYLAQRQISDFLWVPAWRGGGSGAVLAHLLQFDADGFEACGPDRALCTSEFDFARADRNVAVNAYNVRQKAELLLAQYSKAGTLSPHNVLLAPLGRAGAYRTQAEFDYQYHNYQQLADYINAHQHVYKASVEFGTVRDYFAAVLARAPSAPTARGDLLDYADLAAGRAAYHAGRYSTRPMLKSMLRRLEGSLRSAELLLALAAPGGALAAGAAEQLSAARAAAARLCDHHVGAGTLPVSVLKHVYGQILATAHACWRVQEAAAAALAGGGALRKYVYRDGDFLSEFRSVAPGDVLLLFNSQAQARTEPLELLARTPELRVLGPEGDLPLQVSPVWKFTSNVVKISSRFYKILVMVSVPALSLQAVLVEVAAGASAAAVYCSACAGDALFPVRALQPGDIQVENHRQRLIFDERSGFLRAVVDKATGARRTAAVEYAAFRSGADAGATVFAPNGSAPVEDVLAAYRAGKRAKIVLIVSGAVATDVTLVFGRLLQHTTRVFHSGGAALAAAVYLEARVDYEATPRMRELELFLAVQTDVASDELHTDINGFQYARRAARRGRPLDDALRPATTLAWLQDARRRATLVTEHARGVAALRPGQLTALLERRVLQDDGRGAGEGLADGGAACHRLHLLLEELAPPAAARALPLPSRNALELVNSFTQLLEVFVADGNASTAVWLLREALPADVALLMLRALPARRGAAGEALLVLQRQAASCRVAPHRCPAAPLSLHRTLRHAKAFYHTSLTGTTRGDRVTTLDYHNFGQMELISLIVVF